jgi:hypothetical protein
MESTLKSGTEVLEEFFSELPTIDGVGLTLITSLQQLFNEGRLSERTILNCLYEMRKRDA